VAIDLKDVVLVDRKAVKLLARVNRTQSNSEVPGLYPRMDQERDNRRECVVARNRGKGGHRQCLIRVEVGLTSFGRGGAEGGILTFVILHRHPTRLNVELLPISSLRRRTLVADRLCNFVG
jgi:hypothetical protein